MIDGADRNSLFKLSCNLIGRRNWRLMVNNQDYADSQLINKSYSWTIALNLSQFYKLEYNKKLKIDSYWICDKFTKCAIHISHRKRRLPTVVLHHSIISVPFFWIFWRVRWSWNKFVFIYSFCSFDYVHLYRRKRLR